VTQVPQKKLRPSARTSLKHVGGESERRGDPAIAEQLARAFDVSPDDEDSARAHVHGFHSYPARMHPLTAARLLGSFCEPGRTVLDPFCGSGTVLVEARLAGARALGRDVNPLAVRLAALKARGVPQKEQKAIVAAARWVEAHVSARRENQARVTHKYDKLDTDLFEPHVLLELDSIRDGIDRIEPKALREDVELVFSAILTKASRRTGDTGRYLEERRLAPGYVARLLVAKAEELVRNLETYRKRLPAKVPPFDVRQDDARVLGTVGTAAVDLVITSPPYAATYDYLDHHDVRLRWLRMRADRFDSLELGARRTYATLHVKAARDRWDDELGRTLEQFARVLRPDALALMIIADSAVHGFPLRADEIVEALAQKVELRVAAIASQQRAHFHTATQRAFAKVPRREHLIALRQRS
jgi:SAM-dependent methyltransferase